MTSPPLTPSARLRAAVRLTRWFAARGSDPAHVVVQFRPAEPMACFAGGVPLSRFEDAAGEQRAAAWALAVCHVHRDRGPDYLAGLAEEVRAALGVVDGHCVVRCEPTDPERVFSLQDGQMTDSSPALVGAAQEGR
ncbi:hypothetical protein BJP25_21885 [Actinokineospora bangkokensis]|uniref:Uncharacterized protein n=1 Tax=Actinokineospora bangkokensis TaxID=1193682 RepID=A0A1Q9LL19_9PSEU|nr:hypothetical protein BJP25_21885 [Actinokineospora bangkokensis]